MRALAILFFLLGIMGLFVFALPDPTVGSQARAVALNYAVYRDAVFRHVFVDGNTADAEFSDALLPLPDAWIPLRPWRARIAGGVLAVFGPANGDEIAAASAIFQGSHALGRAENGRLAPGHGAMTPTPPFVPDGNLVSVVRIR